MRKKYFVFILLISICIIVKIDYVYAIKIDNYYYDENYTFLIRYDTEVKKYSFGLPIYNKSEIDKDKEYVEVDNENVFAFELDKTFKATPGGSNIEYYIYLNEGTPKELKEGESLKVYYCESKKQAKGQFLGGDVYNAYIFTDSLQRKEFEDELPKKISGDCITLDSNEVKEGKATSVSSCQTYETKTDLIEQGLSDYQKTKSIDYLQSANQEIEFLKTLCGNLTQYEDYGDICLDRCLDFKSWIETTKKKYGINTSDTGECGFSGRLMVWFSNILRWIKYLLPVAVIVLAILDFIKAIGSDKDDEMKKAQGRFVKRLIAAALAFIIPLIIEFVLDKMGFGYNDCGLF